MVLTKSRKSINSQMVRTARDLRTLLTQSPQTDSPWATGSPWTGLIGSIYTFGNLT